MDASPEGDERIVQRSAAVCLAVTLQFGQQDSTTSEARIESAPDGGSCGTTMAGPWRPKVRLGFVEFVSHRSGVGSHDRDILKAARWQLPYKRRHRPHPFPRPGTKHGRIVTIEPSAPAIVRTLAFLFTDVEGSTRLWDRYPEAMRSALAQHDRLLADAVASSHGRVIKTTGDGLMAVFETARDGVAACVAAQVSLAAAVWGETGPLRVRMGVHVGDGSGDGLDYHGPAVNRAARVMAAGHGGQILLSAPTAALVMDQLPPRTSLRDLGEHLLKDLERPEHVYQVDYPAMADAFMPLTTVEVRTVSLPTETSTFVGRESERALLMQRLLDPAVRLLTVTGPGGIGKTRLALRAALDVEADFAAGVAFVDLTPARDASAALTLIGRELGYSDASVDAQLGELVTRIGRQSLLLVLDNVEQVTGAGPTLLRLLSGCPGLKLLVTSREPLHVREERLFPVPPLTIPSPDIGGASPERLEGFEAVMLFVDRARTVRPEFRITDDNAAVVADICRRLEGLPLAIELAAARLRVFSLEALRERLANRLRALGGGARDLPERQQTLRSTIDWSYQLLTPPEQQLFTVMACFAGAEVEAVEDVLARLEERRPDIDPVDGLLSLTDKSLLRQTVAEGQEPRIRDARIGARFRDRATRARRRPCRTRPLGAHRLLRAMGRQRRCRGSCGGFCNGARAVSRGTRQPPRCMASRRGRGEPRGPRDAPAWS